MWMRMMQVENAFPGVHLPTGGGGGGGDSGEGGEEGDVPEEVPTRWTDQTALNIADDGGTEDERTAAAEAELRLSLLLLLAFQLRSLSSRKSRSPPRPRPRPSDVASPSPPCPLALALARRLLPSTLVTRARRTKHLAEFLNRQSHFNHGPRGLSAPYFPGPCFQGTECVVFRARTAVMTAGVGRAVLCGTGRTMLFHTK